MKELISKVNRMKELEQSFRHSITEGKEEDSAFKQAIDCLAEWAKVKKQIRSATLNSSILSMPGPENNEVRMMIQTINLGEKLPFEKIFSGTAFEDLFDSELNEDEITRLESDMFYSWFSGYDFVKDLYSVGGLIVGVGDLPTSLSPFVDELRLCYVFQRYLAVYTLCRAVIEITISDLYKKNKLNDSNSENYIRVKKLILLIDPKFRFPKYDPTLYQMTKMLTSLYSYEHMRDILDDIREKTNPLVHGNLDISGGKHEEIIKVTLQAVHDLYEVEVGASA